MRRLSADDCRTWSGPTATDGLSALVPNDSGGRWLSPSQPGWVFGWRAATAGLDVSGGAASILGAGVGPLAGPGTAGTATGGNASDWSRIVLGRVTSRTSNDSRVWMAVRSASAAGAGATVFV